MNRPLQRMTRVASLLVWATFACRALTPLGYMPASLDDGGPYILCPGGWQAELVQYLDTGRGDPADPRVDERADASFLDRRGGCVVEGAHRCGP